MAPQGSSKSRFRGDIQGLRALAVLSVMVWHANETWLPGGYVGVDVFFVISGFLMTGILLRDTLDSVRARDLRGVLARFYARRVRRLLPASLLVLGVVAILAPLIVSPLRVKGVLLDVLAGAGFSVNWRMAQSSVDYLSTTTQVPSPLQHYWSLGVEEQFYFVWPLLLIAALGVGRYVGATRVVSAAFITAVVLVSSLAASVLMTLASPSAAYFVTQTRLWELAAGALIAIVAGSVRVSPRFAGFMAWIGLAGAVAPMLLFTSQTPFPGYAALLPVGGTALLLLTSDQAGRMGPDIILSPRPMRAIGDWSYSLYLWHWPVLVFALEFFGDLAPGWRAMAVALSFAPAYASYKYVEEPTRRAEAWSEARTAVRAGVLSVGGMLTAALCAIALIGPPTAAAQPASAALAGTKVSSASNRAVGAEVLAADPRGDDTGAPRDVANYYPAPEQLVSEQFGCIARTEQDSLETCAYGRARRAAGIDVVLAGDSHAKQWAQAMADLSSQHDWHLTVMTKEFCPLARPVDLDSPWSESCQSWDVAAVRSLLANPPDLLVTSQYDYGLSGPEGKLTLRDSAPQLGANQAALYRSLERRGTKVAVLRNTPQPPENMGDCAAKHPDTVTDCAFPRAGATRGVGLAQQVAVRGSKATLIDLNDAVCPATQCAAVIGGVLVYADNNHMTTSYGATLAARLGPRLRRFLYDR